MEKWQIEHITANLSDLVNQTNCSVGLIADLQSKKVLGKEDVEDLNIIPKESAKTHKLFTILQMKKNAYSLLIEALHKTEQIGVCEILWEKAILHKIVAFQATTIVFSKVLSHFKTPTPIINQKLYNDFEKKDIPILVNNGFRTPPKYYIERVISRSQRISSDIFNTPENEIFVVTGLQQYELTTFANGMDTDLSSNQTKNVTVQFILLEIDSHFESICNKTSHPTHLIEYSKEKQFNWVKSKGSLNKIRKFLQGEQVTMNETEFINECLQSNRPVCIADTPGMGKSLMLMRMAQTIINEKPLQLVRFLQFKDFIGKVKQPVTPSSLCDAIADNSSEYEIGRELVATALNSEETLVYLFFDGFDEVNSEQVPMACEVLRSASEMKQTRVYAATRLHMKHKLEDMVGGLGFTMLPFREEEQVEFLVKFWEDKFGGSTQRLREFAKVCLESLRSVIVIGEQDIAGIPLVCSMLAQIYENDAQEYSASNMNKPALSRTVSSIFEMYQMLMNDGFSRITTQVLWWNFLKKNPDAQVKPHHKNMAVEELFPDWRGNVTPLPKISEKMRKVLFMPGILEPGDEKTPFRFVHRTFAEYIVAEIIAEVVNLSGTGLLATLPTWMMPKSEKARNKVYKLMFEDVLATQQNTDSVNLKIGGGIAIKSYEFKQPTICYFLNALLLPNASSIKLKWKILLDFVKMYTAAVVSDKPAILKLLSGMPESECKHLRWSELFLLAAKYAGVDVMREVTALLHTLLGKRPVDLKYAESNGIPITPLHVVAQKGDYKLFEYLWNKAGFRQAFMRDHESTRFLLHEYVSGTCMDTEKVLDIKLQIINLFLTDNVARKLGTIIDERLPHDSSTSLLQPNIHVKVLKCLISNGAELTVNIRGETALHIAAINGNVPVADFLITNHPTLVHAPDATGNTPLDLAVLKRTSQHASVQTRLIEAGADIYTTNENGCNPFVKGLKHGKGLELKVVEAIENKHPEFLSAFGGLGLKSLLTNSNLMVGDWNESMIAVAEFMVKKGAVVKCRNVENPWDLEQVIFNMEQIIEATEFSTRFIQGLYRFGILNEMKETYNKTELFVTLRQAHGSYEKLMLSLVMCDQLKPFLIMKQCLQADDNENVWFMTPPPGLSDFILDHESKVFILESYDKQYAIARIRDTVYPDVVVEDLKELSNERSGGIRVTVCPSQAELKEMLKTLLAMAGKMVCIVDQTVTLDKLDANEIKLIRIAYDEVKWDDLSQKVKTKLMGPPEDRFGNCDNFLNFLVINSLETKIIFEFETNSVEKFCEEFVKLAFREIREKHLANLCLVKIAVQSKYRDWFTKIFKINDINYSQLGISALTRNSNIASTGADYFIALLVVNMNYRIYLDTEMFEQFVESVVFKCEMNSRCPTFVNSKIFEYINLMSKVEVDWFKDLVGGLDKQSFRNFILATVEGKYFEISKLFIRMDTRPSDLDEINIDEQVIATVILNGSLEWVKYSYDIFFKSLKNECLLVEYNNELWSPLRLAAHRGDRGIVEHIVQYHGFESDLLDKFLPGSDISGSELKNICVQIIKTHVNQIATTRNFSDVISVIKTRNMSLLYMFMDLCGDVECTIAKTALQVAPEYFTPKEYHALVEVLVQSRKIKCFKVILEHESGATALHFAIIKLEILSKTLELLKSQNVDFNATTRKGDSLLHWAVKGNRSSKVIKNLVDCGANVEATNKLGEGLLHYAARFGNSSVIPLLVSLGCSVKSVSSNESTPLHYAFFNRKDNLIEIVRQLVEHNSDVNARNNFGQTPLHLAVRKISNPKVVDAIQFLILNGADVNIRDKEGNTMQSELDIRKSAMPKILYDQIVQIIKETSAKTS